MVDIQQMIERISKNVNCTLEALSARMDTVLDENRAAWMDAGKTDEECQINALRIAGRQVKSEGERLKRSGATLFEGMFISAPRYKDWADFAYKKAAKSILDSSVADAMVDDGLATVYEDNNDGSFSKKYNAYLARGESFDNDVSTVDISELPKDTYSAGNGVHFHLIWDKASPTFPSGDKNFKYGNPRPLSEKDRNCMFLGRKQGDTEVQLYSMRFTGALAEVDHPTFVAGSIAMRPARNGNTAYAKVGVSTFAVDDSLQTIFSEAPDTMNYDGVKRLEGGLQDIESFVGGLSDKEKWDALVSVVVEVVHIDPRDNGGYVITVGDLDIMSVAGTTDIYVPASQESLVDFSVGSTLMVLGQPYMSRDDEARLVTTGWWCAESLGTTETLTTDVEGWD
tara:strand:+ start:11868 stop:13058 length:1191 start_codon:yes stop_codon:yes gene_type:complete